MDTLFMVYNDSFVIPGNNAESKKALKTIREKTKERKEVLKRIREKSWSNFEERQKLKWRAELLRVQIRHAKSDLYIYEHKE